MLLSPVSLKQRFAVKDHIIMIKPRFSYVSIPYF